MRLFLLRHGLADRGEWDGPDDLRPLTEKGIRRMKRQADRLKDMDLGLGVVLTSPLTRAVETAEIVASRLGLEQELVRDERLAFGFNVESLAAILKDYGEHERILLVGHEPSFSTTLSAITGGSHIVFKKGGLARADLFQLDPPQGDLVWLIPPKAMLA